jgi:hypothetical protein
MFFDENYNINLIDSKNIIYKNNIITLYFNRRELKTINRFLTLAKCDLFNMLNTKNIRFADEFKSVESYQDDIRYLRHQNRFFSPQNKSLLYMMNNCGHSSELHSSTLFYTHEPSVMFTYTPFLILASNLSYTDYFVDNKRSGIGSTRLSTHFVSHSLIDLIENYNDFDYDSFTLKAMSGMSIDECINVDIEIENVQLLRLDQTKGDGFTSSDDDEPSSNSSEQNDSSVIENEPNVCHISVKIDSSKRIPRKTTVVSKVISSIRKRISSIFKGKRSSSSEVIDKSHKNFKLYDNLTNVSINLHNPTIKNIYLNDPKNLSAFSSYDSFKFKKNIFQHT